MLNNTQLPYSVPTRLKGQKREEFQGGKGKVLELLNTLDLEDFLKQFVPQILPLESAKWFALDCAKLVLYVFEKQYPNDERISNCIKITDSYLKLESILGCAFDAFLVDACDYALEAVDIAYSDSCAPFAYAAHYAAAAANAAYCAGAAACVDEAQPDAALYAWDATSKDEMQAFIKNWIDNYFNF